MGKDSRPTASVADWSSAEARLPVPLAVRGAIPAIQADPSFVGDRAPELKAEARRLETFVAPEVHAGQRLVQIAPQAGPGIWDKPLDDLVVHGIG